MFIMYLPNTLVDNVRQYILLPVSEVFQFLVFFWIRLQVDLDNIDYQEFPKVEGLDFIDCVLEEGEMLYIPPKWWHYVRSLSTSFSVSFWWSATAYPSEGA